MQQSEFERILSLDGLPFIQALLSFEEQRFDAAFLKGSVYEEMNANFGIFPPIKSYPVYFAGDVCKPNGKIIFIGINPGYNAEKNKGEQEYLECAGSFEGYCKLFEYLDSTQTRSAYYAHIGGFLRRLGILHEKTSWKWCQDNFINLELIPYHSIDTNGLRINNLQYFKDRYFVPLTKIIDYLQPEKPIFINGFPTYERYFSSPLFRGLIDFEKHDAVWVGTIAGKYRFVGLPFLNRVAGGKDKLADMVKKHMQ